MKNLFDIRGRVVVVTGGAGILGRSICAYLAGQGARVAVLDRDEKAGEALVGEIRAAGGDALFFATDVLNREVLVSNREAILGAWGQIDILLNAAGGNMGGATIAPDKSFLDLEIEAFRKVVDLNLFGTVLPTTVFGEAMTARRKGVIVNFCSESALRPLTRVVGYGAAKAAIANYTKYMAAELAIYEDLAAAGIPHYTGADSFVRNGAFAACGVNYTNLGAETANLAYQAITQGMDSMEEVYQMPGDTITVNTETAEALGADYSMFEGMAENLVTVTTTLD